VVCMCLPLLAAGLVAGARGGGAAALAEAGAAGTDAEVRCLTTAYFKIALTDELSGQAARLTAGAADDCKLEVDEVVAKWKGAQLEGVRLSLTNTFGHAAREQLEAFVTQFTEAESKSDAAFLAGMARRPGLSPAPANYAELRKAIAEGWIKGEVESASRLLSEIQVWLALKGRDPSTPPLYAWIHSSRAAPLRPSLALAEPAAPAFVEPDTAEGSSPLDSFAASRKDRLDKKHELARAGIQQINTEREAWEQEYGAKKLAAAQVDAENVKRQADALVETEKQALEQRKNSWSMKIKTVLGSTVSAFTEAVVGTVGKRAADKAANAIFDTNEVFEDSTSDSKSK
jgi:hypothetical protein